MSKTKSGSGLIFAVILMFVILAMVVTLSSVTVLETKMSQKTKSSVGAFYNADSGVEWALNRIATTPNPGSTYINARFTMNGNKTACPANFGCEVYFLKQDGTVADPTSTFVSDIKVVRSVGTQNVGGVPDTQRAIEAAVAGTDVPAGAVMFFNLAACPSGWTELAAAQGRYVVGTPSGGTNAATVGTALSNTENRPTGQHTHSYETPTRYDEARGDVNVSVARIPNPNGVTGGVTGGAVAGTNAPYIQLRACIKS